MLSNDQLKLLCQQWKDSMPPEQTTSAAIDDPAIVDELPPRLQTALASRHGEDHPKLSFYALRQHLGLPPCPNENTFRDWVNRHGSPVALVETLGQKTPEFIDFANEQRFHLGGSTDPDHNAQLLFDAMGENRIALGSYLEDRAFYREPQFFRAGEARSTHLGVDVFEHADTPVHAPFDGKVHSLAYNAKQLDYGATIILEHEMDAGAPFFTLYGHLSRESLASLYPGDFVAQGAAFCSLGDTQENGGWVPHLHFQVILDMLGYEGDYPGVAYPSELGLWRSLSPDPGRIVNFTCQPTSATEDPRTAIKT